jgi:hypothetical protein
VARPEDDAVDAFLNDLGAVDGDPEGMTADAAEATVAAIVQQELVIERKTGKVRQAGAAPGPQGAWVDTFRARAEGSLFLFAFGVLGLTRLTRPLHRPVCQWLQKVPSYRKLYLLPRDHLKTSIARSLAMHIHLQPPERNVYFPGCRVGCPPGCTALAHRHDGANTRILYAGETIVNAQHQLQWIADRWQAIPLLKALWPHRTWDNPRRDAGRWNASEITLPRTQEFPESSIEAIGVGGAVTGRHYDVLIKDDLISIEAANSQTVMQKAIEWHLASRSLFDDPKVDLEFILGTRWAVHDLYSYIQAEDPTVDITIRAAIEDEQPIFPEIFTLDSLHQLRREQGSLFQLLYMNDAHAGELVDFPSDELREFRWEGTDLVFEDSPLDVLLAQREAPVKRQPMDLRGIPLNRDTYDLIFGRDEYLRLKAM